ncbi:MAG: RluA family pseudouridine synthase [Simkaniaceae bacterium]|jgi:23S rRNA pseudouridine1911/1915/1917 synthase|nr:MAG: RluA family pseudouridine synthase [Simkaniaceae bacterium]
MKFSVKDLEVLYEDNHLLALNKPAGLLTQPNQTDAPSLEDLAKGYIKKKYHKTGNVFLHPIHRLDKPVSGIVLFARTSKALSRLNAQMRARKIQKTYAAKVEGHLEKKSGELRHQLTHGSHQAKVEKTDDSKEAILSYTVKKELAHSTLLLIDLHTGRYHQIRAQLSHIGHPILGDTKYGSTQKISRLALHHTQLIFKHPITNETLIIKANINFN